MAPDGRQTPVAEALVVKAVEGEPTFWSCPRTDVVRAMSHMEVHTLEDGEHLYRRSDNVHHTYLIISGTLATSNRAGKTAEICQGFLGEEALIGMTCYLGSATAKGKVEILAIPIAVGEGLSKNREFRGALVESLNRRILQQDRAKPINAFCSRNPDPGASLPAGCWRAFCRCCWCSSPATHPNAATRASSICSRY